MLFGRRSRWSPIFQGGGILVGVTGTGICAITTSRGLSSLCESFDHCMPLCQIYVSRGVVQVYDHL